MERLLQKHKRERKLATLVENYTVYNSAYSELNIFETHQAAEKVSLTFDYPVLASMLTGKKVMHLEDMTSFDFFPGESVVIPSGKTMLIDFPEATRKTPTQCLALTIDPSKINEVVDSFNEMTIIDLQENGNWDLAENSFHLDNHKGIQQLVDRLVFTFTEDHTSKDIFIDGIIKELIIRLLQSKARNSLLESTENFLSDHRIAYAIGYIKAHLTENISIDKLVDKACMSKSHFFKIFKNTLGISPIDYITCERIKLSKKLIKSTNHQISEIAYLSGFNNPSYFAKKFKEYELITPGEFKQILSQKSRVIH
ncbi:AraC family transcriptional regulator [Roseivirga ehrenbergii]|uniref:AraC family transcriptional regulator n=1 Tax=Roseivirga ehrenbergii (strain DSM 102268 / JCM 13514 / KCTC 12282 / NCIMB 14502 / KMM 6017) TaxID=279360 RepID=A0A150X728_ROSEK|nr:AraC family transcriptional regulator [Roseivirga ehrenbergii]KYG74521.1 AraC family transcriptional regulator [Roseivirga ehrenbergii]TCL14169.1 AraC family transcriptional regulator [Roseivirga ehrenbergii]